MKHLLTQISFYTSTRVSSDDGWLLLYDYKTNIISTAEAHRVTQQEFRHASYQGVRQEGLHGCVHARTHVCR